MRLSRAQAGFSLLEVVTASALLLMTVTALSGLMSGVLHRRASLDRAGLADQAVAEVAEELRAMPFCRPSSGSVGDGDPGVALPATQVGELFPHADASRNIEDAYVVTGGTNPAPGSFVTVLQEDGTTVTRAAVFCTGSDLMTLTLDDLGEWDAEAGGPPPSDALLVTITATRGEAVRSMVALLRALPARLQAPDLTEASGGSVRCAA